MAETPIKLEYTYQKNSMPNVETIHQTYDPTITVLNYPLQLIYNYQLLQPPQNYQTYSNFVGQSHIYLPIQAINNQVNQVINQQFVQSPLIQPMISTIKLNENIILNPITVQQNVMTVQCLRQYQPNTMDIVSKSQNKNNNQFRSFPPVLPIPMNPPDDVIYVNPKQYARILIRRKQRVKLEVRRNIPDTRQKYLYESRHIHAINRIRNKNGRFSSNV